MVEKAYINPTVFRWARETARMSPDEAAKKVSVPVEKLYSWESGDSLPTVGQAKKLANAYRRSFAIFFLPRIPQDFQPLQDFRKAAAPLGTASTFIIRDIQQKQAWVRELYEESRERPLPFVGKYSLRSNPQEVAEDILNTLQINPARYATPNKLRTWISKAEEHGIFVSKTSYIHSSLLLKSDELQGFTIADEYAPFVFINTDDYEAPQLFTLVHELAHIWIAESGIFNHIDLEIKSREKLNTIESFCNEVAAAALMPMAVMEQIGRSAFTSSSAVFEAAKKLGVSSFALLVRALNLQLISFETYRAFKNDADAEFRAYKLRKEAEKAKQKLQEGRPNPYQIMVNKNSRLFTQLVIDAFRGGVIEPTQASSLLNTKINKIPKLEAVLYK